jgi:hypothetical protein
MEASDHFYVPHNNNNGKVSLPNIEYRNVEAEFHAF